MTLSTQATFAIGAFASAALLSGVGTWLVGRWSLDRGFVDRPGGHKAHGRPVALGGGIAVTMAVALPMILGVAAAKLLSTNCPAWIPEDLVRHLDGIVSKAPVALAVAAAAMGMCAIGLTDDARPLHPGLKLLVQLAIALMLVVGFDLRLMSHLPAVWSGILSVCWILTLTNSFNFLDNMDGLATGVGMIAAGIFAATAMGAGQLFVPVCCCLLAGALAGFLPFNLHPARVFLGDAGSLVIGLFLAVFTILTTFAAPSQGQRPFGVLAPLVVMAVPLYDTISVVYLRWTSGKPIWAGDRRHFSHRLVQRGMGARRAVAVIWLATLVTALPAMILPAADWPLAWGVLVQTILVVVLVALLESSGPA